MADSKTTIGLTVKIDGVDREIASLKDLKQAKKDATDAFLRGDKDAAKALADLKDKTEDLTDATQTLKGSGVEKLTSSFGQLKDGFSSFDGEKISTAFKGIGSAMKAIPLLLIVEGIRYLVENFDELSSGSGFLAKALRFVGDIITTVTDYIYKFTDALGLTNSSLDKMGEAVVENANKAKEALASQNAEYDRQIAIAKASGKSAVDIEKTKQQSIIDTNKALVEQTIEYVRNKGVLDDEMKKNLTSQLEAIKNARVQQQVIDLAENAKDIDNYKKHLEEKNRLDKEYAQAKFEREQQVKADIDANIKREQDRIKKELDDERQAYEDRKLLDIEIQDAKDARDKAARDKKRLQDLQDLADAKALEAQKVQLASDGIRSVQQLTDLFFMFKSQKAKKGSKEEEEIARKQFNVNKGLQLGLAVIDGFKSITSSLAQSPIAVGVVPNPIGIASLAFASITAATNIAKIAASKFQSSGSSGGGESFSGASVNIPAPPTVNTPNANTNSSTQFDSNGRRIGSNEQQPMKISIGVDEVTKTTNRVDTLEKQSTF